MVFDDATRNTEAEAGSFANLLGGEEGLSHFFPNAWRNAATAVSDGNSPELAGFRHGEPDPFFGQLLDRIDRVVQQVQEHLRDFSRFAADARSG